MVSVEVAAVPVQPLVSVALTVIGKLPICVVVPERTPVALLRVMPLGSAPVSLQAAVPRIPVAVNGWVKATPAVPALGAGLGAGTGRPVVTRLSVGAVPVQ